jgi:hypothetical protein
LPAVEVEFSAVEGGVFDIVAESNAVSSKCSPGLAVGSKGMNTSTY